VDDFHPESGSREIAPAVPSKTVDELAPSVLVVGPDKEKFLVPASAQANRAMVQMTVSRVRSLLDKTIRALEQSDGPVDALTLSRIAAAVATVNEQSLIAFEGRRQLNPKQQSDFERLATGLVRAAAEGAGRAAIGGEKKFEERLAKLRSVGSSSTVKKKTVDAEVVDEE